MARALLALCLLAACGGPAASTPREALEALRSVVARGDGSAYYELLDSESAARCRAEVRVRRAQLARGDDASVVLRGMPVTADEVERGKEKEACELFLPRAAPMFRDARWLAAASVVLERPAGDDVTRIGLRGDDGAEHGLWFVREGGRWRFDALRTRREW